MVFCEIKANDDVAANKWFRHCEKERLPYVLVTRHRKYSAVTWDYVSLPKEADSKLDDAAQSLLTRLQEVFQRHAGKNSKFNFSAKVGGFDNMLPEQARAAAFEVFDLLRAAAAMDR